MRVGIIGGGAAGLAAAYELGKRGHQAHVFERAPFLGGQASTFDVGGGRLERGYHHLFMSDTHMVDLIHELGLGHKLAWIESKVGFFHGGRIWKFTSPTDLLRFGPFAAVGPAAPWPGHPVSPEGEGRPQVRGVHRSRVAGKAGGQASLPGGMGADAPGQVRRALPGDQHDLDLGQDTSAGRLPAKALGKEKLGYPMGSFGEVFDKLGDRVAGLPGSEVHISAGVRRVVVEEGRATGLEVETAGGEPEVRDYDAVIATTPSYVFTRLVPPLPEEYSRKLTEVNYLAAVLMVLVLDRPLSDTYWLNIADRSMPFVGIIEQTNLVDPSLYGGNHLVYLTNYPSRDNPLYQMSGEDLLKEFVPHLRKVNPRFDPSWILEYHHHKVDAAQPIIGVNYSSRMPDIRTPIKALYLANTTQIYPRGPWHQLQRAPGQGGGGGGAEGLQ